MAVGKKRLGGWEYTKILDRIKKIDSFFTKSVQQPSIGECEDDIPNTPKQSSVERAK